MSIRISRRGAIVALVGVACVAVIAATYLLLRARLQQALSGDTGRTAPVSFLARPEPRQLLKRWGSGDLEGVAATATSLYTAGGSGVFENGRDISSGLPTLRASAICLWRGRVVVGLAAGGVFIRREQRWEEVRTGFGILHARVLAEARGGELFIGAQEGLFRLAWGANVLERLDASPVRTLALDPTGTLLAGGEQGLRRVERSRVEMVATPDPWVDWIALRGQDLIVATPLGLASGPVGGSLIPVAGAPDITSAAWVDPRAYVISEGRLLRLEASGRLSEEFLPAAPRRVFASGALLFVDTSQGLFQKGAEGWNLVQRKPASLPPGPCHVNALASLGGRLVLGLFDGGLVTARTEDRGLAFDAVPESAAWGVNAMLPSGGALHVASLRGTARYDGTRLTAVQGIGGTYALAITPEGLALGTGQGVLLPDGRCISAFHGLPGNQALALATQGDELFVGTPSGLGVVRGAKVLWRATAGDGRLPHPWITALAVHRGSLFIGTYGGGVARRTPQLPSAPGLFTAYPETAGMKVNTGCLLVAGNRVLMGTDGRGLYLLSEDASRFLPLDLPLPSPRITALHVEGEWLYIGTDEGLTRISLRSLLGA